MRYTDEDRGSAIADTLGLYWLSGTNWVTEGITTVVQGDHVITSTTDHFTLFAVLGQTHRLYLPLILRWY